MEKKIIPTPPKRPIPQKPNITKPIPQKPILQKETQVASISTQTQKPQIQKNDELLKETKSEERVKNQETSKVPASAVQIKEKTQPLDNQVAKNQEVKTENGIKTDNAKQDQKAKTELLKESSNKIDDKSKKIETSNVQADKRNEKNEQTKEVIFGLLGGFALVVSIVCFVLMFIL